MGAAGHITSPWLVYGLLNLAGLALLLSLTHRLRTRPRVAAMLRWMITLTGLAALIYVGNGFFEFRSSTSESVAAFFGRLRFTALVMMILTLRSLAKKFDTWLNKVALVVLTLPIIWTATKIAFLALPPHDYVTYLILFATTATMGPDILERLPGSTNREATRVAAAHQ